MTSQLSTKWRFSQTLKNAYDIAFKANVSIVAHFWCNVPIYAYCRKKDWGIEASHPSWSSVESMTKLGIWSTLPCMCQYGLELPFKPQK